jgi:hypothetical protein
LAEEEVPVVAGAEEVPAVAVVLVVLAEVVSAVEAVAGAGKLICLLSILNRFICEQYNTSADDIRTQAPAEKLQ